MRICVMVEGQEGVEWRDWVAIANATEQAGLHGLFRSDHYTSFHNAPAAALDAWSTIAALGAVTSTIRLGTLVSPVTFRHPSEFARIVVSADHISGGRVDVGIGAGWFELEHQQNGFPFPSMAQRMATLDEYVQVVRESWSADEFDFSGDHYTLSAQRALPAPVQHPHPPIIFGGRAGPKSAALAARFANEYNVLFLNVDEIRESRQRLDDACATIDRDPASLPLSMMTAIALGDDQAEAEDRFDRQTARFRGSPERFALGTVDNAVELLSEWRDAGLTKVYVQHPNIDDLRSIELLGVLGDAIRD